MARRPLDEMVNLSIKVPRGHDGFWRVIRDLDNAGDWDIPAIVDRCGVDRASVKDFVLRLVAAGYAKQVGTCAVPKNPEPKKLYRLVRAPMEAPRLDRKGNDLGEQRYATLWRTMKMVKTFTVEELAEAASADSRPISSTSAEVYLRHLRAAGVVLELPYRQGGKKVYRLARNLGAKAPHILKVSHCLYDPNSRQIIGPATGKEVDL